MGSDNGHPFGRVMVTRKLERLVMIFVAVNSIGIYVYLRGREPCEQMIRGLSGSLGRNPPAVRNLRATAPVPDARPCTACPGRPKLPTRQAGAARPWNSSVRCAFITPADKHRVIAAVAQHLQGWMKSMADDDGMGSLWSPPEFHEEA